MKKIKINLHPFIERKEQPFVLFLKRHFPFVFISLLILMGVNVLLFMSTNVAQLPYSRLQEVRQSLTPTVNAIRALRREVQGLQRKRDGYAVLFQDNVTMSHVFADIYASLPINIWFESIVYGKERLSFVGYVLRWKEEELVSVNRFINALKKQENFASVFKRVTLKNSRIRRFSGVRVVRFQITCER